LRFAEAGHRVTGFDTDPVKVSKLNAGKSYIDHIPQSKIQQFVISRHFSATTDFFKLKKPTRFSFAFPLLSMSAASRISATLNRPPSPSNLICKKAIWWFSSSTTYPGTTEELVLPILEKSGLRCPVASGIESENIPSDFFLAFSPEREDPGNKQYGLAQIPKVVGGANPPSSRAAQALYAQVVARVVPVSSTRAAEMAKLLENIFRCVNIALVNELKLLATRMNIDIWKSSTPLLPNPSALCRFIPAPALAVTAFLLILITSRGKRANSILPPASSNWPEK